MKHFAKKHIIALDKIFSKLHRYTLFYTKITLIILFVCGIGLRLGYRLMVDRYERDEITYINLIEQQANLQDGETYNDSLGAFIYLGIQFYKLTGDCDNILRFFNLFCSILWLISMYMIGRLIWDYEGGLICLTLAVFNPYMIRMSMQVMQEPMYILLLTYAIYLAIQIIKGDFLIRNSLLIGLVTSYGWWVRYEGVEMFFIMPLAIYFLFFVAKIDIKKCSIIIFLYLCSLSFGLLHIFLIDPIYYLSIIKKATGMI